MNLSSLHGPETRRSPARRRLPTRSRPLILEALEARLNPGFVAPMAFSAGPNPWSVATGEFNGDGLLDLAVANNVASGTVSVLLGTGTGSFEPARTFAAGSTPRAVAVGDFNGDGALDLAVANGGSGRVSVLLGNGDGTFQAPNSVPAGSWPSSVAVGEFNGDGFPDLAVANLAGGLNGSVLLGNGDGSFQAAQYFPFGGQAYSLAIGDFNGDSSFDLAAASSGSVKVLLGNGNGTFQNPQSFRAGYLTSVAVGDVNGDGLLDLAATGSYRSIKGYCNEYPVSVLLGNGDGTFEAARSFRVGRCPESVAVGDVNGDGLHDLAVANQGDMAGPPSVSVLLSNGDGSFRATRHFTSGGAARSVTMADVNADGLQDLAVANDDTQSVSVFLSRGDGSFGAPSYPAGPAPYSVVVGDVNGDGVLDLAVANYMPLGPVSVLLGNGDGSFQPARNFPVEGYATSVAMGDVNGDGNLDLAVACYASDSVSVLLGNGDGSFQAPNNFPTGRDPWSVAVGEFNGDGALDLAVANSHYSSNSVSVLLGNGDGTFQPARNYPAGTGPSSVAVGEFNGDEIPDLVTERVILLGNGDGTFQAARNHGGRGGSVAVGDFNGDGWLDLVTGQVILLGNGDGSFQPARDHGGSGNSAAARDFNGDGLLDLAVMFANGVRVLLGNGNGTFQPHISYLAGIFPSSLAVGDFSGDGWPDLAVANWRSQDVSILLNDGIWGGGSAPGGGRGAPDLFLVAGLSGTGDASVVFPALSPVWVSPRVFTPDTPRSERLQHRDVDQVFTRSFGGRRPGGDSFAITDGAVRFVSERTPLATLQALSTRADGEVVTVP